MYDSYALPFEEQKAIRQNTTGLPLDTDSSGNNVLPIFCVMIYDVVSFKLSKSGSVDKEQKPWF